MPGLPLLPLGVLLLGLAGGARAVPTVYPSGPSVPENLLRLSVVFKQAPHRLEVERLQLENAQGPLVHALLQQALWSPDGKTLTLLLHPARVKTGLQANLLHGRALTAGQEVRLVLRPAACGPDCTSGQGQLLKSWQVGPAQLQALAPERWTLTLPRVGTRQPLQLHFDLPIDKQAQHLLTVVDSAMQPRAGSTRLSEGETRWSFVPQHPWRAGHYQILLHPELEDSAGNRVGASFEHAHAPASQDNGPGILGFTLSQD